MRSERGDLPGRVEVVEVGPRDGFQMEEEFVPTELKVETVEGLVAAGLRTVEVTSFVHPKVIPQMRDAVDVVARTEPREGWRATALVPNLRGAERALAAGVDGVHGVICVTETYNRRNVGLSRARSVEQLAAVVEKVRSVDPPVEVAVTMAATFGCPFEGQLGLDELVAFARTLADTGVDVLGLADSAGLGDPVLVDRVVGAVREALPDLPLRMHLHDTRGLGLANAFAALRLGVTSFDTAFGGLGGCPMIRGASGNVATEDFVHLCDELGIETGVDLDRVRTVSRRIAAFLGRELPSRVLAAGTRAELLERNRVATGS